MTMSGSIRCASIFILFPFLLCLSFAFAPGRGSGEELPSSASPSAGAGAFKEHYERGVIYYKSGQYHKAIEEFQSAYEARPRPMLLFNLGQAHRKIGHPQESLDLYERFLREDPQTDLRAETESYMTEVRAEMERQRKTDDRQEPPRSPDPVSAAVAQPPPPISQVPQGPRRPFRIAKWVLAGAGLLAIAAGATLLALDGRPTCDLLAGQKLCPQQLDTLGLGIGVLVGGALVAAGGGALFAVDYRQATHEGPHTAMLTLAGRF